MKKASRITGIIIVLVIVVVAVFGCIFACDHKPLYHVVVVFSHEKGQGNYDEMCEEMEKTFKELGDNVSLSYDYLCCERWDHEHEIIEARRILRNMEKVSNVDLVITIGDQASYSVMQTETSLIKNVPVVFGGVLYPNQNLIKRFPNYTGFRDSIDVVKNIHAAYPLLRTYATFTMLDETFLDRCTSKNIRAQIDNQPDIIDNINWEHSIYEMRTQPAGIYSITPFSMRDLSKNTAQKQLRDSLGATNLVFVMRQYSGMSYIQMKYDTEALAMIRMNGSKAMLTAIGAEFGKEDGKFIGGYFAPVRTIARDVATRASQILHGADPKSFEIGVSQKDYYIDWNVAKRSGFSLQTLPEGFNVVNLSWKERHPKLYIVSTYSSALVALLVIAFLAWLWMKERRKRAEALRKLERENILYNMAVETSLTYAWERVLETIYLGDAFWIHYKKKPHPIYVDDFMRMIHPESRALYAEGLDIVNSGKSFSAEIRADFADNGVYHWYLIRGKGVLDADGKYLRSYGMLMKIDELKERERELEEARRMAEEATLKESFLANMSHEIRTPLNAIVGFSDLLAMPGEEYSDDEKKLFIDTIHTNNELLLKLINDILEVSRIESGQMEFVIKPYSVTEIVDRVYQTYMVQAPTHLGFYCTKPEQDYYINVDEGRLRQVLINFLTNAGKFTPEGSITLGWRFHADTCRVEIFVRDTGIGLSEQDRKMVFSRFYKKDEFKQGTGLGLSICKVIVSRLGGSIKVESELGKGSTFSVFLDCVAGGGDKDKELKN